MAHVFISHARPNREIAVQVCRVLEKDGQACWIAPRNIAPGARWPESIVAAIAESGLMITIVSKAACRSRHVARELERADNKNIPILPIRIDSAPLDGTFEFFLSNKQWLELPEGSLDDHVQSLLQAVRALYAEPEREKASANTTQLSSAQESRTSTRVSREPRHLSPRGIQSMLYEIRDVLATFAAVMTRREKALDDFELADPRTLFYAVRFMIYMSLASLVLEVPAASVQGISVGNPGYALLAFVADMIEKATLGVLLYAAMRGAGGKADLQHSMSAFGILCAFQPLITICLVPVHVFTIGILKDTRDAGEFVGRMNTIADQLSASNLVVLAFSFLAASALWILFLAAVFRAFRALHQLGRARGAMAFAIGATAWVISLFVVLQPFRTTMYRAFGVR